MMHRGATMLLSIAVCAGLALTAPAAAFGSTPAAAPTPDDSDTAPSYISGLVDPQSAEQTSAVPPVSANTDALRSVVGEADAQPERPSMQTRATAKGIAAVCTAADFAQASGQALVTLIKGSTTDCVNTLFSVKGSQAASIFTESKMVAAANGLRTVAQSYTGDNSASAAQLVLFLRAGYYVQYYNSSSVPAFGTALRTAVSAALDQFFDHPRSKDVTDANGETLSEAITLIDSAELNDRYIHVVKRLLTDYNAGYNSSWWMLNAVNGTFTVLFRGHQVPAFVQKVASDTSLLTMLKDFALGHTDLLAGENSYLVTNAGHELGRFLGDAPIKAAAKPLVRAVLDRTSLDGPTSGLWVALAEMADWYDKTDCGYYGTCNLQERIEAKVLPITHVCSPSITIRAQDMNAEQLSASCASLNAQDAYFHAVAKDPGPVPGDVNTKIEVVVFDSSTEYQAYAGTLFGIDTNNGGMYLEGDPTKTNNKARFIAYEAEWLRPEFAIWNLNHEYTHYLDGRFNMHGDFTENIATPTIWWVEGFAEYISYHYRQMPYTAAQQLAATGQYKLSQLFDTTYDHDTDRIYRWGYLAVSFMLNKHPIEMQAVLGDYRSGNWNAARSYLKNSIGTTYDAEFTAFLAECAQGNCSADLGGGGEPPRNQAPTAAFTVATNGLTATFTDGSSDPDGQIASRAWDFGNGRTSTEKNPSVTYAQAGSFTVALTVKDDKGATATTTRTVTVKMPDTGNPDPGGDTWTVPVCADADTRLLGQACGRMGLTAKKGESRYLMVWVPAGTPRLTITSGGGSGDANLYVSHYGWPSPQSHVARSTNSGNGEQVVVEWPASGWNYVALHGVKDFANVSAVAHY